MSSSRILLFVGAGIIFLIILISSVIKAGHSVGERLANIQMADQKKKDSLQHIQDSLNAYLTLSDSLIQKHNYDSASRICDIVISIDRTIAKAYLYKGIIYRQEKKLGLAADSYSTAIRLNESTGQAWFDRALCYLKQKKKKEAVNDVKHALNFNYHGADSLYNKINPIKKRIVGSHCVCCDGSISYSSGRGTCSHHGGVCGNEYDYQEYREY